MNSYERTHVKTLLTRLNEPASRIIALFGPRQTGKSTIVQQALRRCNLPHKYLAVDQPEAVQPSGRFESLERETYPIREFPREPTWLVRHWETARQEAHRNKNGFVLVIDEIQKIPDWSEAVKGLWDADHSEKLHLKVVILGSAPLLIQSGLSESLAGRFETISVNHWSFDEMSRAFDYDLPSFLYFGGYPGSASLIREPDRWRDYILRSLVDPNIQRDILSMQRVDKPALLRQLFELGAGYSGQILSYTKMLGELRDAGNTTTLARYLDLLSAAGLIAGLQKFAIHLHRRRASSPKLVTLNTALMTAGSGYTFEEANADRTYHGRIVETAVGAHLYNSITPDMGLYYWRENPYEVDYVLRRGPRIVAIEVKSGKKNPELLGLEEFKERFRPFRSLVVEETISDYIEESVPLNEFLTVPARYWFEES